MWTFSGCSKRGFSVQRLPLWSASSVRTGFRSCGSVALQDVGSPQIRDPTHVLHIGRRILCHWATREALSVQFSSVAQSCPTLCDPMNRSMPGLLVQHQLPEFTQTHVHWVSDAIQPSHPLSSSSPPAHNPSQHQGLFQWVNSSHEVARVLEFQLQHQSFQWTPRTDLL